MVDVDLRAGWIWVLAARCNRREGLADLPICALQGGQHGNNLQKVPGFCPVSSVVTMSRRLSS
jgi:hypothetical protein